MTQAPAAAPPSRLVHPLSEQATTRIFLALVLLVALLLRLWVVATQTYIAYVDETFQYLESAHRLVFGSGVVSWEFLDGIRSWLLPGMVAAVMWAVALIDPDPSAYIATLRVIFVLASLSVPFVGFQMTARRLGPLPALLVGLLCAFASEVVYLAPVIMTDPLATYATVMAIWLGDTDAEPRSSTSRALAAGLLFGLAASLRFQYGPVLAVAAVMQHWRSPRTLAIVTAGGAAVVIAVLGILDTLTWGLPFQTVWLNYFRNEVQGISGAMSTSPWYLYGGYYILSMGFAAPALLGCAVVGATRAPALAGVILCTIGLHSVVPHKEVRYVFLATACLPMLTGMGLAAVLQRMGWLRTTAIGAPVAVAFALAVGATTAVAVTVLATPPDAWHRDRSILQATAAAREIPGICGLGVRTIWVYRTGGYTYWHRDAPIYFETWDAAKIVPGSTVRLRVAHVLDGAPVAAYPGTALAANTAKFNVMIGAQADGLPGFIQRACFGSGAEDDPSYCVFTRPGGCT